MKEKTVGSPAEHGEYLLYDDESAADGSPLVSVSFRKTTADGTPDEYDFEPWKTFATWDEAEEAVEEAVAEAKAGRKTRHNQDMKNGNDRTASLVDAIYARLPMTLEGRFVDAEFNDDGSIQIFVGQEEYNLVVKKEAKGGRLTPA